MSVQLRSQLSLLLSVMLASTVVSAAQTALQTPLPAAEEHSGRESTDSSGEPAPEQKSPGSINGAVVDQSGAAVVGARVQLIRKDDPGDLDTHTGTDGQFFFPKVAPGDFQLAISAAGFAAKTFSGSLKSGEVEAVPPIAMDVADARTEVEVSLTQVEVATEQIRIEEKQRVLGAIPNFYVSYIPDAAPLTPRQKFQLAFRTVIDPFTVVVVGGIAGVQQAQNHFAEYGQGAQGYGKRFGAGYADAVAGTFIGSAVLPSLLKQDPRYFYKGTGSVPSRFFYAVGNAFICKGDNKRWQVNYSNILGNLAAGGISNLYYPENDRSDASLTLENGAIGIGATAIGNLFQEFLIKKLTPKRGGKSGGS